eukprot:TRINITY_DN3641_c0_g1_i3.p1 TRINITY_DN3641_c0_g1~~TRINITY_DN3641_c0_g1_i3.p1  ORF type:complete len:368 (+),score=52.49 TRINITY_DN3641_c0_g1_i3:21-1124(+)
MEQESTPNFREYESFDLGVSFTYPHDWSVGLSESSRSEIIVTPSVKSNYVLNPTILIKKCDKKDLEGTPKGEMIKKFIASSEYAQHIENLAAGAQMLSNVETYKASFLSKINGIPTNHFVAYMIDDDRHYIISYHVDRKHFNDNKDKVNKIFTSIYFHQKKPFSWDAMMKIYENLYMGFYFRYPENWIISDESKDTIHGMLVRFKNKYSSSNYEVDQNGDRNNLTNDDDEQKGSYRCPYVECIEECILSADEKPSSNLLFSEYVALYRNQIEKFNVDGISTIVLPEKSYSILKYKFDNKENIIILLPHSDNSQIVSFKFIYQVNGLQKVLLLLSLLLVGGGCCSCCSSRCCDRKMGQFFSFRMMKRY